VPGGPRARPPLQALLGVAMFSGGRARSCRYSSLNWRGRAPIYCLGGTTVYRVRAWPRTVSSRRSHLVMNWHKKVDTMSVAFIREESAETAAEVELPDRPISPHPNLVTASGLEALASAMAECRAAYNAAQQIEGVGERRRAVAIASREMRYFVDRLRSAQIVPPPADFSAVAFGHRVTFKRDDGRRQVFRIVGEDEADPRNGSISYVSPVARALIGKAAGDFVLVGDHEIEILYIE
jgi:transcription elongation GreA/GreB family factor